MRRTLVSSSLYSTFILGYILRNTLISKIVSLKIFSKELRQAYAGASQTLADRLIKSVRREDLKKKPVMKQLNFKEIVICIKPCVLFFLVFALACNSSKFNKSSSWQKQYKETISFILSQNKFGCYFGEDVKDSHIKEFMSKENIQKICYNKSDESSKSFKDSTITFEFNYNPFFGKKRTLLYKLYTNKQMDDIISLIPTDRKIKKIDNDFLYIINDSPSFGE